MCFLSASILRLRTRILYFRTYVHSGIVAGLTVVSGLVAAMALSPAMAASTVDRQHAPLDFSYRVHGTGPGIGVVFDDGRDVFLQPLNPAQISSLQVMDRSHRVQGPYLVVRGLINRIEVGIAGSSSGRTVIEYRGRERADALDAPGAGCTPAAAEEQRVTVPFGTGALQLEPGGLDHLARMLAVARGARRVTIVSQGERPNAPIALRRSARVRELLVAAGIDPGAIVEQVQPPAASSVHVIAVRDVLSCVQTGTVASGAPASPSPVAVATATAAVPARLASIQLQQPAAKPGTGVVTEHATPAAPSLQEPPPEVPATVPALVRVPDAGAIPDIRLMFRPDSSVQSTLRAYLKAHGMDVEFRSVPLLMVEEFAQVEGSDVREVLRRALARLGLRGEIQGNRLLVVELAR